MADAECITKVCTKCGQEKRRDKFARKSKSSDGLTSACKACANEQARKRWDVLGRPAQGWSKTTYSEWPEERKAEHRARKTAARRAAGVKPFKHKSKIDSACILERNAREAFDYWMRLRATDEQVARWWAATGKPWMNKRLTEAEKYRMQYALDIQFQVNERMRRQVTKARKRDAIGSIMRDAIKRDGASRKVERELGYSIADLMRHIEKQFTKRMTWDKFRAGEIHIDHIIPQASFDLADDDEWRRCWCLSNLRPMWASENIAKGARVMTLC